MAIDAIIAGIGAFMDVGAGAAAVGADVAATAGAADLAATAGVGAADIAAGAGAAGAGVGADLGIAGAGAGLGDIAGTSALGFADTGATAASGLGTAALDTVAAAPAATAAGAGAAAAPSAALDVGAATGVLDAGGLGTGGIGSDAIASASSNAFGSELGITQDAITNGTFDTVGANSTTFAPSAEMTSSFVSPTAGSTTAGLPPEITTGASSGALNSAGTGAGTNALDNFAIDNAAGAVANQPMNISPTAAGGSGTSGGFDLGSLGSTFKSIAPYAGIAGLGYNLIKGEAGLPPQGKELSSAATNLSQLGQQNLAMAANNQITPSQAAQIEQWKQRQRNALYQTYARNGRDPRGDTDYQQGLQQIDQQAVAMQQQFINQLVQTGLGEMGQATSALTNAANMQISQDNAFSTSITNAFNALGMASALSGLNRKAA